MKSGRWWLHLALWLALGGVWMESAAWSAPLKKPTPRVQAQRPLLALVMLGSPRKPPWYKHLQRELQIRLGLRVRWFPAKKLPRRAYHRLYRRYRAERLCRYLSTQRPKEATYIVGLTQVDISTRTPGYLDHAVFGLADHHGPAAILSTYRLRTLRRKPTQYRQVWLGILLHEIGHLMGLPHCAKSRCVMQDAHGSMRRLLRLHLRYCPRCKRALRRLSRSRTTRR